MPLITPREKYEPNQYRINNSAVHNIKTSDFKMSDDGGLGYWSLDTRHSSFRHLNYDGISDDEILGVSDGDGRRGYRSLETIHPYFQNCVVYYIGDQSGDYGRGGNRS